MNPASSQLQIPDRTPDDPKAIEIVRVWMAHGEQHVAIRVGVWKKPEAWGIVLADLAMHLAQAYEQHAGRVNDRRQCAAFSLPAKLYDFFEYIHSLTGMFGTTKCQ